MRSCVRSYVPRACAGRRDFRGKLRPTSSSTYSRIWPVPELRPLNFCMITTFYPPYHFGGDGVFVYRLAEALAARGHRVDVLHSLDAYRLRHPGEPEIAFTHHPNVTRHALKSSWPSVATLLSHQLGGPARYAAQLRAQLEGNHYD